MGPRIESLDNLVLELSKLPGIGEKTAARLAHFVLKNRQNFPAQLRKALKDVEEKIKLCPECFAYTEQELCHICSSLKRQDDILCVVEEPSDVFKLEAAGGFRGKYHILHGSIAPMQGIRPDDLKISELIQRAKKNAVQEVILALDADLEGDTTALYIAKMLEGLNIKVTRLAHGIPFGGDIDYIDHRTLGRAFANRVEL